MLAQPSWLPGLSLSFDYYDIKIDDVVSSLSAQQIVNLCCEGNADTCSAFNLQNTAGPNFVNVQAFNLASIKTRGFDIEASCPRAVAADQYRAGRQSGAVRHAGPVLPRGCARAVLIGRLAQARNDGLG
ncbi:hypothetical protein SPHINGO8AM_30138 [Sphingomonas sp. 8AM]|nr:hypothetical protein SPHINGO8AM_30138 [Sphingomonas sp. 8AM]